MNNSNKDKTPSQITLRPATDADCAALSRLAITSKAHWGYDDTFLKACEESLTVTPALLAEHRVILAQSGAAAQCKADAVSDEGAGEPLGYYALSQDRNEAEVAHCFVSPAAIGKGIGGRLWKDLEAFALSQGATQLTVLSDPNAAGFYRRMGMEDAGTEPSDVFGSARPLPVLKKRLGS
ncbi:GNAT family N-acetyltransferase [Pelagibius sp. Alg239-R121]|uniref:GNAT family N-acetyltransferase n=1 Tax=Pelagibius sp. Alg239-R121 TaxID=2993448 RepID=UPI0024A75490|nr:GNAT family N-acetyltransferase [Pelagibius sp. Alg239-R121]